MTRKPWLLAMLAALLLSVAPVLADDGFYVVAVGGGVGTKITGLPYPINNPGFYFLAGNLDTSGNGITVNVDNVTIDLMGFTISGPGSGTNYGIHMNGRSNIEIRNGTIRNFGKEGISEEGLGSHHRCLNLRVLDNKGSGISLNGNGHTVKSCTVSNNSVVGIFPGHLALVHGNIAYYNGGHGIYVDRGLITNNACRDNGWSGYGTNISPMSGDNVITENYAP
jgi:hypothetical protein